MQEKQELERELMLLESALRIFLVRDPVLANKIEDRIIEIEKELRNGNYQSDENRRG